MMVLSSFPLHIGSWKMNKILIKLHAAFDETFNVHVICFFEEVRIFGNDCTLIINHVNNVLW